MRLAASTTGHPLQMVAAKPRALAKRKRCLPTKKAQHVHWSRQSLCQPPRQRRSLTAGWRWRLATVTQLQPMVQPPSPRGLLLRGSTNSMALSELLTSPTSSRAAMTLLQFYLGSRPAIGRSWAATRPRHRCSSSSPCQGLMLCPLPQGRLGPHRTPSITYPASRSCNRPAQSQGVRHLWALTPLAFQTLLPRHVAKPHDQNGACLKLKVVTMRSPGLKRPGSYSTGSTSMEMGPLGQRTWPKLCCS
mmetsp:Transcript_7054/g.19912  ORF Transcript_7054/g.19912 Transcript_7054/m.19912 type:complete len:247 (+) Transcript_7054:261-1001(+)